MSKKVLLVDDDADLLSVNRAALEGKGYKVETAMNGKDGIKKAQDVRPDVIVLDVMMSTSSEGFDAARALRKSEETKRIPIIMLTSVNQTVPFKFEPDETYLPVSVFMEKPVKPDTLMKEINKLLA
ncbi:MAG: response regulator [Deltaproteobacteria bacterium]|nr:response regulator [Deltaproteobacteria bacterium]